VQDNTAIKYNIMGEYNSRNNNITIDPSFRERQSATNIIFIWDKINYVSLIGIIGNALVIIFFLRYKRKTTASKQLSSYHFLIVQLAVIDLLVCVVKKVYREYRYNYKDETKAVIALTIVIILLSSSCWALALLSFERYRTIVHPFKEKLSKKRLSLISLCISLFIITFWLTVVTASMSDLSFIQRLTLEALGYIIIDLVAPLMSMCYFYHRISNVLQLQLTIADTGGDIRSNDATRRKKKVLKTLKYLIAIYAICVAPGRISYLIYMYVPLSYNMREAGFHILEISTFLIFTNNVANIFVYVGMMGDFRRFLFKVLTCGYRSRKMT
jgi:7 transmembrane receptor (rhodopsin family).